MVVLSVQMWSEKEVLKCRIMCALLNDKGFGPMSVAGPIQL